MNNDMRKSEAQLYEMYKKIEEIRKLEDECNKFQKKLEYIEEEVYWQNRAAKKVTDNLFDSYPKDTKLQKLLLEREDLYNQKIDLEKVVFNDLWNMLNKKREKAEEVKEWCELQLKKEGDIVQ